MFSTSFRAGLLTDPTGVCAVVRRRSGDISEAAPLLITTRGFHHKYLFRTILANMKPVVTPFPARKFVIKACVLKETDD